MVHHAKTTLLVPLALVTATVLATPRPALAQEGLAPPVAAAPSPTPGDGERDEVLHMRFSGKRLVVEMLTGALVGSLVAYGTFDALCEEGSDCFGAAFGAYAANTLVTPLAVWGTGHWMGGGGSLTWTYMGGLLPLAAFSAGPSSPDETYADTLQRTKVQLAVATFLLPVTTALLFEVSSQVHYARWMQLHGMANANLSMAPVFGRSGVEGLTLGTSFQF
jgi:hypothetical protein